MIGPEGRRICERCWAELDDEDATWVPVSATAYALGRPLLLVHRGCRTIEEAIAAEERLARGAKRDGDLEAVDQHCATIAELEQLEAEERDRDIGVNLLGPEQITEPEESTGEEQGP